MFSTHRNEKDKEEVHTVEFSSVERSDGLLDEEEKKTTAKFRQGDIEGNPLLSS